MHRGISCRKIASRSPRRRKCPMFPLVGTGHGSPSCIGFVVSSMIDAGSSANVAGLTPSSGLRGLRLTEILHQLQQDYRHEFLEYDDFRLSRIARCGYAEGFEEPEGTGRSPRSRDARVDRPALDDSRARQGHPSRRRGSRRREDGRNSDDLADELWCHRSAAGCRGRRGADRRHRAPVAVRRHSGIHL